ncbi:hypothetical protein LTR85_007417 [Meristemomyces frigidus]|nr:hypothetical protein LTR85_007417 [Meristemomyces frigidus]
MKAFPDEPALTYVSREIRKVARPFFWQENTFKFHMGCGTMTMMYGHADLDEARQWLNWTTICAIVSRITLAIEFTMAPILGPSFGAGVITISSDAEDKLSATFAGALAEECTCELEQQASEISRVASDRKIVDYADTIATAWKNDYNMANRQHEAPYRCTECGKAGLPPDGSYVMNHARSARTPTLLPNVISTLLRAFSSRIPRSPIAIFSVSSCSLGPLAGQAYTGIPGRLGTVGPLTSSEVTHVGLLLENCCNFCSTAEEMSRFGGPGRSSADELAYGDIPQRWDRDRFERFGARGPPPQRFQEDYRYEERDRPGRREVAVADRIDERGPAGRFEERDRYFEEDRYAPGAGRPQRKRTDRELFGDVDPRELAGMAMTPYRRKSVSRPDLDIDIEIDRRAPPRPGILRRQSSLDTFDRRPAPRYNEEDEYRMAPYTPVPLPIRRPREEAFEEIRYRDHEPEDYREVEIQRERSVHRRRPAKSVKSTKTKSVTTRQTSPSSASSESFEEIEKEDSIRESIAETARRVKKGKTRMPKRLVRREAILDLGYPFDEEEDFYVLRIALEKDQIDEVIKISEQYKEGGIKKVYRFEEKEEIEAFSPPPGEHEEVVKTEWVNPPTIIFGGARSERARSVRAPSPSSRSTTTRRTSPARTRRSHSRRPSSPGTIVQERRTIIEERGPPPPPPPGAIPIPPPTVYAVPPAAYPAPPAEYYEDRRTIIEERAPAPSRHGGELVVQERDYRSDRDIQSEIRALEAERRALRLEREAEEKRDMAVRIRERPTEEEFQLVEYRERRPTREVLEVVERERSPPRNVMRVEKDRKARKKRAKVVAAAVATLT